MLAKCIPNILESNWYQQSGDHKKILKIRHHMLMLSTQLQKQVNFSHRGIRTRTAVKCTKMKMQSMETYCFSLSNMQICDVLVAVVIVFA